MTFDFENKCFLNNGKKYEIVFLEDIDCSDMKLIKNNRRYRDKNKIHNHYRNIYLEQKTNLYYKIWEKEFIHNEKFTNAMKNNIYDNDLILPLKSLIFDKEYICRGYITHGGELSDKNICDLPELFEIYKKNVLRTKYIISIPKSDNIIRYKNKYTLIDYDIVFPINKIRNISELELKTSWCSCKKYSNFLKIIN